MRYLRFVVVLCAGASLFSQRIGPPGARFAAGARPTVSLGRMDRKQFRSVTEYGDPVTGRARRVDPLALARPYELTAPDGGLIRQWTIQSTGAAALRVHLRDVQFGRGELWIYPLRGGGDHLQIGPYGDGEIWSDEMPGDTIVVEHHLPPGVADANEHPFQMEVIHLWSGFDAEANAKANGERAVLPACFIDAACRPETETLGKGVGALVTVATTGEAVFCSGGLVETSRNTGSAYFLTATHCIEDAQLRSSLVAWDYRRVACGGTAPSLRSRPRSTIDAVVVKTGNPWTVGSGGFVAGNEDVTLLRLSIAPASVVPLRVSLKDPVLGERISTIGHPAGDLQHYVAGLLHPSWPTSASRPQGKSVIDWNPEEGRIFGGNSGGPTFNSQGEVIGVLSGATEADTTEEACASGQAAVAGRIAKIWEKLKPFLDEHKTTASATALEIRWEPADAIQPKRSVFTLQTTSTQPIPIQVTASASDIAIKATTPFGGTTPSSVEVTADPARLTAYGTIDGGRILITPTGSSPLAIPVRLTLVPPLLTTTPVLPTILSQDGVPVAGDSVQVSVRAAAGTRAMPFRILSLPAGVTVTPSTGTLSGAAPLELTIRVAGSLFDAAGTNTLRFDLETESRGRLPISFRVSNLYTARQPDIEVSPLTTGTPEQVSTPGGSRLRLRALLQNRGTKRYQLTGTIARNEDRSAETAGIWGSSVLLPGQTLLGSMLVPFETTDRKVLIAVTGSEPGVANSAWRAATEVPLPGSNSAMQFQLLAPQRVTAYSGDAPTCTKGQGSNVIYSLYLAETGGQRVNLTNFRINGINYTTSLLNFFGTTFLEPFGTLRTTLCASVDRPPLNMEVSVTGTDTAEGNRTPLTAVIAVAAPPAQRSPLRVFPASLTAEISTAEAGGHPLRVSVRPENPRADWTATFYPVGRAGGEIGMGNAKGTGPGLAEIVVAPILPRASTPLAGDIVIHCPSCEPQELRVPVRVGFRSSEPVTLSAVVNGASLKSGEYAGHTWITIFGGPFKDASVADRTWADGDFQGTTLPELVDAISVRIGGKNAPVFFAGRTQLNVLVPDGLAEGEHFLEVATSRGTASGTVTIAASAPGIFTVAERDGARLAAATSAEGQLIGDPSIIPGSRAAVTGETISIYATGLGPTAAPAPAGQVVTPSPLARQANALLGGKSATVTYAGLVGSGLYQVNLVVPPDLEAGQHTLYILLADGRTARADLWVAAR